MGAWTLEDVSRIGVEGAQPVGGVNVDTDFNVKGTWTELTPALPFEAHGVYLCFSLRNTGVVYTTGRTWLIDLAISDGTTRWIIAADLPLDSMGSALSPAGIWLPITIPAGVRLDARGQNSGSNNLTIDMWLLPMQRGLASSAPYSRCHTFGANTGLSKGTVIDPGLTADTKGAWTVLGSDLTVPLKALSVFIGHNANNVGDETFWNVDVAFAPSTPVDADIVLHDLPSSTKGQDATFAQSPAIPGVHGPFPLTIPADGASDLWARAASSQADGSDRLCDVVLVGFD